MSTSTTSTTEERALTLLGHGVPPSAVANALGVDPSRITQLLADDSFAAQVVEKKFEALSKHAERDTVIDSIEDRLLDKLRDCLPFMTRPMEIIKSFQVINASKRRASVSPDSLQVKQTIIQLNIPQIVLNKFTSNVHNQVVQIGDKSLVTVQSNQLLKVLEAQNDSTRINSVPTEGTTATTGFKQESSSENSEVYPRLAFQE